MGFKDQGKLQNKLSNEFRKCSIKKKKLSKLIDQVYFFIKMYGVKGKLYRTSFKGMASFYGFRNALFCRHF